MQFDPATYPVSETIGAAVLEVTLSAEFGKTVTVDYATKDGSALAPGDYTVASGTLTFTPGDSHQ